MAEGGCFDLGRMLTVASYLALVLLVSAPGRGIAVERSFTIRGAFAFAAALCSTLALPWSGAPPISLVSPASPINIFGDVCPPGAISWLWFPAISLSLAFLTPDRAKRCAARRCFAFANTAVSVTALEVFILNEGVPGGVPGMEGLSAILAVTGTADAGVIAAMALFFASLAVSHSRIFLTCLTGLTGGPPRPRRGWAISALDFSYCAFLAIVFVPASRIQSLGVRPDLAAALDFAARLAAAMLISRFVIRPMAMANPAARWFALPSCLTAAAVFLLFYA